MASDDSLALARAASIILLAALVRWAWEAREPPPAIPEGTPDVLPELLSETEALVAEEERRALPLGEGETIELNTASEIELDRIPGIGPALARRIVQARDTLGGFRTVEDLLQVKGIGPATLARIRERVTPGG